MNWSFHRMESSEGVRMTNMNSGYMGYSMSNRAAAAYMDGEKPRSNWTKAEIISAVEKYASENEVHFSVSMLKKLKVEKMRSVLLYRSSWHHTSSYCNRTEFYSIDIDRLDNLTDGEISSAIESDKKKEQKQQTKRYLADVHYLEWYGTRKHPKAEEHRLEGVEVEEVGCFYYIYRNDMLVLKKKIGSTGTYVYKKL